MLTIKVEQLFPRKLSVSNIPNFHSQIIILPTNSTALTQLIHMPKEELKIDSEDFDILSYHDSDNDLIVSGNELAFTDTEDELTSLSRTSSIDRAIEPECEPLISLDDGVEDLIKNIIPASLGGGGYRDEIAIQAERGSNFAVDTSNINRNSGKKAKGKRNSRKLGNEASSTSAGSATAASGTDTDTSMDPFLALHGELENVSASSQRTRKVLQLLEGKHNRQRIVVIMCGAYNAEVQQFILRFYEQFPLACLYWNDESNDQTKLLETPSGRRGSARQRVLRLLSNTSHHPNLKIRFWGPRSVSRYIESDHSSYDKREEHMSIVPVSLSGVSVSNSLPATEGSPVEIDRAGGVHSLATLSDLKKVRYTSLVSAALSQGNDTKVSDLAAVYQKANKKTLSAFGQVITLSIILTTLIVSLLLYMGPRGLNIDSKSPEFSKALGSEKLDYKELALRPTNEISTFLAPLRSDLRMLFAVFHRIFITTLEQANLYSKSAADYVRSKTLALHNSPNWRILNELSIEQYTIGLKQQAKRFGHLGEYFKDLGQHIKDHTAKLDETMSQNWERVKRHL